MPNYRPDQLAIAVSHSTARIDFNNTVTEIKNMRFANICKNLTVKNNTTNPTYQIDITADILGIEDYIIIAVIPTADITVSGVNGLDIGTETPSTWYSIWVIFNPTTNTIASILSLSSTSPTLPSGYTHKQRVGWIYNDISSNFITISFSNSSISSSSIPENPKDITPNIIDIGALTANTIIDWNNGSTQRATLGANITLSFNNNKTGSKYILILIQDTTGNRTVTWSGVIWGESGTPSLSTTANKKDYIGLIYNGTTLDGVAVKKGH